MKSRDLIFLLIVVVVVGGLYFLSTRNKAKPLSTTVPEHLTTKAREDCLKCHQPEALANLERQHKHPGKWRDARVSCLLCHTSPAGARAASLNPMKTEAAMLQARARRKVPTSTN
ncbi:MAG: hypothetical protein SF339_17245 [Blastocatellia bacterium]|nr:hypothetical protein [Blastocatellia bacterium]